MTSQLVQSTDYVIKELTIKTIDGQTVDITPMFEELNIFDSIFSVVMSGNILIRDAIQLSSRLKFDGSEILKINITKPGLGSDFILNKSFRIKDITNRKRNTQTSETYVLHFVPSILIKSEKQRLQDPYGTRTDSPNTYWHHVTGILKSLTLEDPIAPTRDTLGERKGVYPNMTPLDTAEWMAKRMVNTISNKPDYLVYQTKEGMNLQSLTYLMQQEKKYEFNCFVKHTKNLTTLDDFLSVTDVKVLSTFNMTNALEQGMFGGTMFHMDPMTRKWEKKTYSFDSIYINNPSFHCNPQPNFPDKFPEGIDGKSSRIVSTTSENHRKDTSWIQGRAPEMVRFADRQDAYYFSRKSIFATLQQKRVQITIPGNFNIFSGNKIYLKYPKFSQYNDNDPDGMMDPYVSGNFIVAAVRHLIKYNKHQTIVELTSDSNLK